MSQATGRARAAAPLLSFPPGSMAPHAAWSEVTALGDDVYRIRLGGFFDASWLAHLCAALAEHRLSIARAHALRAHNGSWLAELVFLALEGASDPYTLPYVTLAESPELQHASALSLLSYELVETTDHNGSLRLKLEASDTLGLLGSLLVQLASLSLYPVEMHIDTHEGRAEDCLWLITQAANDSLSERRAALEQLLQASLTVD